jgi:hypothetical protein
MPFPQLPVEPVFFTIGDFSKGTLFLQTIVYTMPRKLKNEELGRKTVEEFKKTRKYLWFLFSTTSEARTTSAPFFGPLMHFWLKKSFCAVLRLSLRIPKYIKQLSGQLNR